MALKWRQDRQLRSASQFTVSVYPAVSAPSFKQWKTEELKILSRVVYLQVKAKDLSRSKKGNKLAIELNLNKPFLWVNVWCIYLSPTLSPMNAVPFVGLNMCCQEPLLIWWYLHRRILGSLVIHQFYHASFPANGALSSPGKGTVSTTSLTTSMLSKGTLLISSFAFSGHPKNRELAMIGADAIFITLSNREVCPWTF